MNEIIANCTNCEHVKYYHTDGIRLERCEVFHKKDRFKGLPINPEAEESVMEGNLNLCEKYQQSQELLNQGIYAKIRW